MPRILPFRCDLLAKHHARVVIARILLGGDNISENFRENHSVSQRSVVICFSYISANDSLLVLTCFSESAIPTIVQSVGVSSRLNGKLASFPRHQKTSSPIPAPAASTATRGLPCGAKSLLSD